MPSWPCPLAAVSCGAGCPFPFSDKLTFPELAALRIEMCYISASCQIVFLFLSILYMRIKAPAVIYANDGSDYVYKHIFECVCYLVWSKELTVSHVSANDGRLLNVSRG